MMMYAPHFGHNFEKKEPELGLRNIATDKFLGYFDAYLEASQDTMWKGDTVELQIYNSYNQLSAIKERAQIKIIQAGAAKFGHKVPLSSLSRQVVKMWIRDARWFCV